MVNIVGEIQTPWMVETRPKDDWISGELAAVVKPFNLACVSEHYRRFVIVGDNKYAAPLALVPDVPGFGVRIFLSSSFENFLSILGMSFETENL